MEIVPIAYIQTPFDEKFGSPRQSGLAKSVKGVITFETEFADKNALRGIETFSHLWLIWGFSEVPESKWSATVRPPKLGGNERVGVFATRSPFRPNHLAMSAVKFEEIRQSSGSMQLVVSGVDMVNETPIYDIKPYVPYADCIIDATGGLSNDGQKCLFAVRFLCSVEPSIKQELAEVLGQDPHPLYQNDKRRIYKMSYAGKTVSFRAFDRNIEVIEVL